MSDATRISGVVAELTLVVNALAFFVTALMAFLTWRNISLLTKQIRSQAQGNIFDAHKDLYFQILSNDKLCSIVAGTEAEGYQRNMLASILINHCARIFADYEADILRGAKFNEFSRDAADLFSVEIVRERWPMVRMFHSEPFRVFVDSEVLHDSLQDRVAASK